MSGNLLLQVGNARVSASLAGERERLAQVLRAPGSVRELSIQGQAVRLTTLLRELDPEERAEILSTPRAIWDLATCGAASEVAALVADLNAREQTLVLSSAMAVAGLARGHYSTVWSWLEALPPTAHALILRAEGAIAALIDDRGSAGKIAGLIAALEPSTQVGIFSRTDAIACMARHGQSARVLELLARRSGEELASFLPGCGALQRMADEGHVGKLAELVSSFAPNDRASMLASFDGFFAFTKHGRRAQVKEWLLALDVQAQQRVFALRRGLFRELVTGPDAVDADELAAALGPTHERMLRSDLQGVRLRERVHQQTMAAIEWLEAQPLAGCFSVCDQETWSALRSGGLDVAPERHVAALTKLTRTQRAQLFSGTVTVGLFARLGAAEPMARLLAELPERERFEILLKSNDIAALASGSAAALVAQMIEALPSSAQIRLFREVRGHWKESLWPAQTVATKLALMLGELDAAERFELVVANDNAAVLVTHGYSALVSDVLDACSPEQCLQLLQATELVPALCREEGLATVAARLESLPPKERVLLLTHSFSVITWAAEGLAPTLFRLLEQLEPIELARVLQPEPEPDPDPMFDPPHVGPIVEQWLSTLARPADERLKLVRAADG